MLIERVGETGSDFVLRPFLVAPGSGGPVRRFRSLFLSPLAGAEAGGCGVDMLTVVFNIWRARENLE